MRAPRGLVLIRALRAIAFVAMALVAVACSYDFSHVPRTDAPPLDGGGADAGSTVTCDPIADTGCSTTLTCSASIDTAGALTARCTTPGSGTNGAACSGLGSPGNCGAGLLCVHPATGGTCTFVCTGTTGCPGGFACDRDAPLYSLGSRTVYRCR